MKDFSKAHAKWVGNIHKVLLTATADEIANGEKWYAEANLAAFELANRHNVQPYIAAGVIAALSPNNRWEINLANADTLISAYLNGEDILSVRVATYHAMRAKAWSIMDYGMQHAPSDDGKQAVADILNGQKIRSFFACILGDENECTIDGHARNIAYSQRLSLSGSKVTIGKREYKALQAAYAQVGREIGMPAYAVQAVTWVAWRRAHGIA